MIGFTCASIQIAALPAIAATYAVDSYKLARGPIFISIYHEQELMGLRRVTVYDSGGAKGGLRPSEHVPNHPLVWLWCGILDGSGANVFRRWTAKSIVASDVKSLVFRNVENQLL